MPTPTAAERLHAQQQKNRKAAGLPDPSEYKKKLDAMKSEEVEQLDEISDKLKASYVSGAKKQIKQSLPFTKKTDEYRDIAKNFIAKRQKGIARANEEVEQLDEYESKSGVYKHKGKYGTEYTGKTIETLRQKDAMDLTSLNKHLTSRLEKGMDVNFGRKTYHQAQNKNHLMNVHKNLPEEVEQLDEMPESNMKVRDVHSHLKKAGWALARSKGGHDVFKHPKAKHSIPVPRHSLKAPLVRGIMKASKVEEQLEKKGRFVSGPIKQPFKSNTIVTSVKEAKDSQEYDYEGDMAKSDLRSILHHAKELHDMIEDNTNLAEWCQSKITLAEDYLSTVANYMRSEMNEETIEEDKNDYQRKIEKNNKKFIAASKRQKNPLTNVHTAQTKQKPVKEDVEQLDEKKNLPGLWANIRAKKARGESPAKPGDKDYPEDLESVRSGGKKSVKESASEPTEGEMKGKQGVSRKAQIVRDAARGKKSDNPDKFQKDPELSSEIHKT